MGEGAGWAVTWSDSALLVHAPSGAWRVEGLILDLADAPAGLPVAHADAVLCSAFLDLVSASWLERLAVALHRPFFAALNVDGRDAWLPPRPRMMHNPLRVLITGAGGLLGSELSGALADRGHAVIAMLHDCLAPEPSQ